MDSVVVRDENVHEVRAVYRLEGRLLTGGFLAETIVGREASRLLKGICRWRKSKRPGAQKKSSKLLVIILLAVVLGGGGFFGFKIMSARNAAPKKLKVGSTIQLEEFLVNLADGKTFLKAGIALGIAEGMALGHGGGGHGEKAGEPPEVRDAIIMILTSKQPADLATTEGKEQLKKEIIRRLNEMFNPKSHGQKTEEKSVSADKPGEGPEQGTHSEEEPNRGPVLEVYFTSFATQRY